MEKKKILIVDDDKTVLSILEQKCRIRFSAEILTATTYKEGVENILKSNGTIHAAIIDLNLPDVNDGEMAKYTLSKGIPTVVLTGIVDEILKENLLHLDIVDYIQKDGIKGFDNCINIIDRILKNYDTTIMIVDDSSLQVSLLKKILESIKLNIITAQNGKEALELINKKEHDISLILTDYIMPEMDGMELTIKTRELYDKDELGIIVLSSNANDDIATNFIKIGANDYIDKPYKKTAVITRVNSTLHILDLFKQTKELSFKDFMTGAYNRRYFYSSGQAIFDKAKRDNRDVSIAMIDIDKFKNINDTYGHDIGDLCIIKVVELFKSQLRSSDLICRFGGEEFVVLLENISKKDVYNLFEKVRKSIEKYILKTTEHRISFSVSIGISYGMQETIDDMIKISDEALYYCKENGRNQIKII